MWGLLKDIDRLIMYKLDGKDLVRMMLVCKYFYNLVDNMFWYNKVNFYLNDNEVREKILNLKQIYKTITLREFYIILHTDFPGWLSALAMQHERNDLYVCINYLRGVTAVENTDMRRNKLSRYYTQAGTKIKEGLEIITKKMDVDLKQEIRINWRNGIKHGEQSVYWNGEKEMSVGWRNGKLHGISKKWLRDKNGKEVLLYVKRYQHGFLNGEATFFTKKGYQRVMFVSGRRI